MVSQTHALVIMDFESAFSVGRQQIIQGGFEINMDGPNGFMQIFSPSDATGVPQNGTRFVQMSTPFRFPAILTARDGSLFDLFRIDLGEYSSVFQFPRTSTFIGHTAMGETLTQTFTVDGFFDGPGGLADFESFRFGSNWRNLVQVEFGYGHTFDNIQLQRRSAVPEPGVVTLFLLGLVGLVRTKRSWQLFKV